MKSFIQNGASPFNLIVSFGNLNWGVEEEEQIRQLVVAQKLKCSWREAIVEGKRGHTECKKTEARMRKQKLCGRDSL